MPDSIDRKSLWGLSHYLYGEAYFGSFRGMRYRVAREPLENVSGKVSDIADAGGELMASVWPEPYAYAKTDQSLIRDERFAFSEDGMEQLCAWLNERVTEFNGDA